MTEAVLSPANQRYVIQNYPTLAQEIESQSADEQALNNIRDVYQKVQSEAGAYLEVPELKTAAASIEL